MADTLINGSLNGTPIGSIFTLLTSGAYWISTTTAAGIVSDSNSDVAAFRTTDGGSTWSAGIVAEAGTVNAIACFFDRQRSGDTGTLIHVVWADTAANNLRYAPFDVNAGTWGSLVTIVNAAAVNGAQSVWVTKTEAGGLKAGYTSTTTGGAAYDSADGSSWSSIATPSESTGADGVIGFPANGTGDTADCGVLFWDASASAYTVKMYDDSADTWSESTVGAGAFAIGMSVAPRVSDGHVIVGFWNAYDTATADYEVYDINPASIASPTITALTDAVVDSAESAWGGVFVDPNSDRIYVAYQRGAALDAAVNTKFRYSDDGGSTWSAEQAYGEDTDDDLRNIGMGACGTAGGRFQPWMFNDDLNDVFVNLTNDIEIAAAGGGDPEALLVGGKLIRGGLLLRGALVR